MHKVTSAQLALCAQTGRFAVRELIIPHEQEDCTTVPQGARFVVKGQRRGEVVALFPHDTKGLEGEQRLWSDGHIRIVPLANCQHVGRIG